jgi:MFS family permease
VCQTCRAPEHDVKLKRLSGALTGDKRLTPAPYEFKPHERPAVPGGPALPDHPMPRRIAYFAIGLLIGIAGGLANGLLTANLPQIQGALGITPAQGGWLIAVYSMTNVCMGLLLIKFRQQFGLQRFTRIMMYGFAALTIAQVFVHTYELELAVRAGSGIVGSGLATLGFFYMMQALPPHLRMGAVIIGFGAAQIAVPLAGVISPLLLHNGSIQNLFVFESGLILLCLGAVALLRLPPAETFEVFEPLDFLTFALFAPGMALLCAVLVQGRIVWWSTPWIGAALAAAIVLIGAAMLVEHNRANPLLNTRWMMGRNIVRFAIVATLLRILLGEQTYGSVGLLRVEGMASEQLMTLYSIVVAASVAGLAAGIYLLRWRDFMWPLAASAGLIAIGAFMDAHATNLTRPANLYLSQALIAFAALLFMGPMVMVGIARALARGPSHIVSFSALFGVTQTIGGLVGAAGLTTIQVLREKYHSNVLAGRLTGIDPQVTADIQTLGGAYGHVLGDPMLRQAQGVASLGQRVTREANILAYNDVFLLIAAIAAAVFVVLGIWWVSLRLRGISPLAADLAEMQRLRGESMKLPFAPAGVSG